MAQQPRYNVQTAVPGGVMPEGTAQVANAAIALSDKVGQIAHGLAEEIGIPKAQERGFVAGQNLGWKPGVSIGRIGAAYEESARKANDDYISNILKRKAETLAKDQGDKPNGYADFETLYTAKTQPLLTAVTPERRDYVESLRNQYSVAGESAALAANTENEKKRLTELWKYNAIMASNEASSAAAVGDSVREARAKAMFDDAMWNLAGSLYTIGSDGKEVRFSNEEYAKILYDDKGNRKLLPDGTPMGLDQALQERGVIFGTEPMVGFSDIAKMHNDHEENLVYATVVGGYRSADEQGKGVEYAARVPGMVRSSGIAFDKQETIISHVYSGMRQQLRLEDAEERKQNRKAKAEADQEIAQIYMDSVSGQLKTNAMDRLRELAKFNPVAAREAYTYVAAHGVVDDVDSARDEVNSLIGAGRFDEAWNKTEEYGRGMKLTPSTIDNIKKAIDTGRANADNSITKTDPIIRRRFETAKAGLKSSGTGGLTSFMGQNANWHEYHASRLASMLEEQVRNVQPNERAALTDQIIADYTAGLVGADIQQYVGEEERYLDAVTGKRMTINLPAGVTKSDFVPITLGDGTTMKVLDVHEVKGRFVKYRTSQTISDADLIAVSKKLDAISKIYSASPLIEAEIAKLHPNPTQP